MTSKPMSPPPTVAPNLPDHNDVTACIRPSRDDHRTSRRRSGARYTAAGVAVTRMSLAVRGTEGLIYQDVVACDRLAEVTAEHLEEGRRIRVEGRLRGRRWIDDDQRGCYVVDIVASAVEVLPRGWHDA